METLLAVQMDHRQSAVGQHGLRQRLERVRVQHVNEVPTGSAASVGAGVIAGVVRCQPMPDQGAAGNALETVKNGQKLFEDTV